jgi:hypothetical protein
MMLLCINGLQQNWKSLQERPETCVLNAQTELE